MAAPQPSPGTTKVPTFDDRAAFHRYIRSQDIHELWLALPLSQERVILEFHSNAIEEPLLEDLVRLILGRDTAFLRRAPLAGVHGTPS